MAQSPHQHGADDLCRPYIILMTLAREIIVPVLPHRDLGLRCGLLGFFSTNQSLNSVSYSLNHHGYTNITSETPYTLSRTPSQLLTLSDLHFIGAGEIAIRSSLVVYAMSFEASATGGGGSGSARTYFPAPKTRRPASHYA
jgi:hypothetical protein